jgi:hypothetical protein
VSSATTDEIEDLVREIAPFFYSIAKDAQVASDAFVETPWTREHIERTASLNQVSGTIRWRYMGDSIVRREAELPSRLTLKCKDSEQNQGRYYLIDERLNAVVTVRSEPHKEGEEPEYLQESMSDVLADAPVAFGSLVKVYLSVPATGHPTFEVTTQGAGTVSYRLIDWIDNSRGDEGGEVVALPTGPKRPRGPIVRSSLKDDQASLEGEGS